MHLRRINGLIFAQKLQQLPLGLPLREHVLPQSADWTGVKLEVLSSCKPRGSGSCGLLRSGRVWKERREGRQVTLWAYVSPSHDVATDFKMIVTALLSVFSME